MIKFQKLIIYLKRILERTQLMFRNVEAVCLFQALLRMETEKVRRRYRTRKVSGILLKWLQQQSELSVVEREQLFG